MKPRTLNSYETQVALTKAIASPKTKCKCKVSGVVEGMSITVGEELDFVKWLNPDTNQNEYLLLLDEMPLVSISKREFDKHMSVAV